MFTPDYDADEQMEFTQTEDVEVLSSFDSMGLKEDLLRGIYAYGMQEQVNQYTIILTSFPDNFIRI